MAAITAKMVQDLRTKTGCGMMECKKALTETDGNFDEAVKVLREKGLAKADSKQSRIAAEGIVDIMFTDDKKTAVMIEVNTETDFVAKNEKFQEFVKGLLRTVLACKPADVEALNACKFDGTDDTVADGSVGESTFDVQKTVYRAHGGCVKGLHFFGDGLAVGDFHLRTEVGFGEDIIVCGRCAADVFHAGFPVIRFGRILVAGNDSPAGHCRGISGV
jgi:elongation factor Ts